MEFLDELALPASLHAKVILETYKSVLNQVPFFIDRPASFVVDALPALKPFLASAGERLSVSDR